MKQDPSKILIADEYSLVREGLRAVIASWNDFRVVGEARNGEEALELARQFHPAIILMEISQPRLDGIEITRRIRQELPGTHAVLLTGHCDEAICIEGIKAGAQAIVSKSLPSHKLHSVLQVHTRKPSMVIGIVRSKDISGIDPDREPVQQNAPVLPNCRRLSELEHQILELVAEGLTNYEIGKRLFMCPQTVSNNIGLMLRRYHVANRVHLVAFALHQGFIS